MALLLFQLFTCLYGIIQKIIQYDPKVKSGDRIRLPVFKFYSACYSDGCRPAVFVVDDDVRHGISRAEFIVQLLYGRVQLFNITSPLLHTFHQRQAL